MNRKTVVITFLSAAALVVGCNKEETVSQQADQIKAEAKQAGQEMRDYTYAQKAEFVQQMQIQLAALNQDVDRLSAKIESSSDAVKAEAKPKLQALRDQADKLGKQLDDVKNADESAWNDVKARTQKAWDATKESFQQARQWVSDKVAP